MPLVLASRLLPFAFCLLPFACLSVCAFVFWQFTSDREPVHYPSENKHLDRNHCHNHRDLRPWRNYLVKMVGQVPIEGYNIDVDPVQHCPDYSVQRCEPNQPGLFELDSDCEYDHRDCYETKQLHEIPVSIWSKQQSPTIVLCHG